MSFVFGKEKMKKKEGKSPPVHSKKRVSRGYNYALSINGRKNTALKLSKEAKRIS